MIKQESIEKLIQAIAVEEVVSDYITLKRAGSNYKGNCPFHDEKSPSFVVNPVMGIYKCFGCQKAGNAIGFVMEIEQLTYVETLRKLAYKYQIVLEETENIQTEELEQQRLERTNQQAAMNFAHKHFQNNLHQTPEGKAIALSYFKEREYTQATLLKWELGWAADSWNDLANTASKAKYDLPIMAQCGLLRTKENGDYYDWYRNRVIFPIHNVTGNVIAFGGRILGSKSDKEAKYINSPETVLYHKSDVLYGLFQAKAAIKKHDKVYLVEGYTDVITLSQNGIENVVASSGTALTENQIRLIKRFTHNITILFDGDAAGQKASVRGIDLILQAGLNVRVISFPNNQDPDSYCKELGYVAFAEYLINNEQNFVFYKARQIFEPNILKDPLLKAEKISEILLTVSKIPDVIKQKALLMELANICQIEYKVLESELAKLDNSKEIQRKKELSDSLKLVITDKGISVPLAPLTDEWQEKALLKLLLLHAEKEFINEVSIFQTILDELSHDSDFVISTPAIALIITEIQSMDIPQWPGLNYFLKHANPAISSLAAQLIQTNYVLSTQFKQHKILITHEDKNFKHELVSVILHLRRKQVNRIINNQLLNLENDPENTEYYLEYIHYLNERKLAIALELGVTVNTV